jgi:hypothetical protein
MEAHAGQKQELRGDNVTPFFQICAEQKNFPAVYFFLFSCSTAICLVFLNHE